MCMITGSGHFVVLVWGTLSVFLGYSLLPQPTSLCEVSFSVLNCPCPFIWQTSGCFLCEPCMDSDRNLKHKLGHMCVKRTGHCSQADVAGSSASPRSRASRHTEVSGERPGVWSKNTQSCLWETRVREGNKENFNQRWENSAFSNMICY